MLDALKKRAIAAMVIAVFTISAGCGSDDDPAAPAAAKTPTINTINDTTGGLAVVGDVIQITGTDLSTASKRADSVTIGGVAATVISASKTLLSVRIPEGVTTGTNVVRVSTSGGSDDQQLVVHRLAAFVTLDQAIVIVDTNDHSVLTTIDVTVGTGNWPKTIRYANNGTLCLVPLGSNAVYWVDMTANPPAGGSLSLTGAVQTLGIGISPDQLRAVVADKNGDLIHTLVIQESAPPYVTPLSEGTSTPLTGRPRAPEFMDNDTVVVALEVDDALALLDRAAVQFTDSTIRVDPTGLDYPLESRVTGSGQLLVSNYNTVAGFRLYDVAGTSLTVADSLSSESSNAIAFDLNAVGDVAFLAWETDLTVQAVSLAGGAISSLATVAIESGTFLTALEVESSAGNFAYVSNEVESLVVTIGADNALSLLTPNPFAGVASLVNAYGIAIQP